MIKKEKNGLVYFFNSELVRIKILLLRMSQKFRRLKALKNQLGLVREIIR